jgi:UDP:flavonoid glycosyltransferase YjiC (YdhE family)
VTEARPRILFVADAVTLAHVARPAALARGLDPGRFEVVFASDDRYRALIADLPCPVHRIASQPSERFLQAAARGSPLYDYPTLCAYLREDLALLDAVQPHAIVADHRLSMAVAARRRHIPYLAINNAYWSPYADPVTPVPDLPFTRLLGPRLAQPLFDQAWPLAAAYHSWPLNRLRRAHGLPAAGWDWRSPYTEADYTLYADAEALIPTPGRPDHHRYLGPIAWSPEVALPAWWEALPSDRPLIYASLGSSGDPRHLGLVLQALAGLPVTVVAAAAGQRLNGAIPANARLAEYLPGERLCARADLVVCNGGSMGVYQALRAGKPVLGIAAHMDQQLSMHHVEKAGVGWRLRTDRLDAARVRAAAHHLLHDQPSRQRAQAMAQAIAAYDPVRRLEAILEEALGRA